MTVAEIIQPGDKIDISFLQQVERMRSEQNVDLEQEMPKVYKSQVLDVKENGNLEISMPSENGRLVLLPLSIRLEFVFFSRGGLYRAIGQIKERYKSSNVYMLEIELKSQLTKYQRREFFRYPCVLEMTYYTVTKEEAHIGSGELLFIQLCEEQGQGRDREYRGQIVDLSGGGIRFYTEQKLQAEQYVLFEIHLENENVNKLYYIVGNIVSCVRVGKISEKPYEVRAKFLIQDSNIREEIIRFIFEEERKTRQRGR